MEFEDVNPEVEREAHRVAVAFGLGEWESVERAWESERPTRHYRSQDVEWQVAMADGKVCSLEVGFGGESYCELHRYPGYWVIDTSDGKQDERMARGLYCLGIEDEEVLLALDCPLSAHEKLELRLALPREFWPQTWLEEERT